MIEKSFNTFGAEEFGICCKLEGATESAQKIIRREPEDLIGTRHVRQSNIEKRARDILRSDEPFKGLQSSQFFAILGLGAPDRLQNIWFPRTCEIHDYLPVFRTESEGGVIFSLNRSRCFIYLRETKDIIDGCV